MGSYWSTIHREGSQIMKYFVAIFLALIALNSLTDAGPLPVAETRDKIKTSTPKEVQVINKWLGLPKTSTILKDILEVASAIKNIKKHKKKITSNAEDIDTNAGSI